MAFVFNKNDGCLIRQCGEDRTIRGVEGVFLLVIHGEHADHPSADGQRDEKQGADGIRAGHKTRVRRRICQEQRTPGSAYLANQTLTRGKVRRLNPFQLVAVGGPRVEAAIGFIQQEYRAGPAPQKLGTGLHHRGEKGVQIQLGTEGTAEFVEQRQSINSALQIPV